MRLAALAAIGVLASPLPPHPSHPNEPAPEPDWTVALSHPLSRDRCDPRPGHGLPGADCLLLDLGGHDAAAIIDRLDGKGIGVFLGMSLRGSFEGDVAEDVRLVFYDLEGDTHPVSVDAHSLDGNAMLFTSPRGMPTKQLRSFEIQFDATAPWVD